jgi:hypothetical protein
MAGGSKTLRHAATTPKLHTLIRRATAPSAVYAISRSQLRQSTHMGASLEHAALSMCTRFGSGPCLRVNVGDNWSTTCMQHVLTCLRDFGL